MDQFLQLRHWLTSILATSFALAAFGAVGAHAANGSTEAMDQRAGRATGVQFRDCKEVCPQMVVIGPGQFEMGQRQGAPKSVATLDQQTSFPQHWVKIRKFALAKHDVTRREFRAFVRGTGYQPGSDCSGYDPQTDRFVRGLSWENPGYRQSDQDPVVCVNVHDIKAYLTWLTHMAGKGYRLPSESEWEYAAHAGTATSYYWGNSPIDACRHANVADIIYYEALSLRPKSNDEFFPCRDGYAHTSPVGSFLPNKFGLYDMAGNVQQVTADCWHYNYYSAPSDGTAWLGGDCMLRVLRGGSFRTSPNFVRASSRSRQPESIRSFDVGFRVARSL